MASIAVLRTRSSADGEPPFRAGEVPLRSGKLPFGMALEKGLVLLNPLTKCRFINALETEH